MNSNVYRLSFQFFIIEIYILEIDNYSTFTVKLLCLASYISDSAKVTTIVYLFVFVGYYSTSRFARCNKLLLRLPDLANAKINAVGYYKKISFLKYLNLLTYECTAPIIISNTKKQTTYFLIYLPILRKTPNIADVSRTRTDNTGRYNEL